eukprot:CAMPEP_0117660704 /NCGR_PEP_ID=MMETSP0804-20121206/7106_1 /TAXON_ID=1074897 /ORGANISM="Tetraselmis astigmatica, Strain CCMP880" /LENGTH=292 /DNA_ID=CAMNT_0005467443 /DNA_START=351 /DNA_END=1230 /DNA_ORIENTATION=-
MSLYGSGSVHMQGRYRGRESSRSQGGGNQICQKCMQVGHWTYECPNPRVYQARPTRTQQLKNPKVRQRFMDAEELLETDSAKPGKAEGNNNRKKKRRRSPSTSSSSGASGTSSSSRSSSSSGGSPGSSSSSSSSGSSGSDSSSSGGGSITSGGSTSDSASSGDSKRDRHRRGKVGASSKHASKKKGGSGRRGSDSATPRKRSRHSKKSDSGSSSPSSTDHGGVKQCAPPRLQHWEGQLIGGGRKTAQSTCLQGSFGSGGGGGLCALTVSGVHINFCRQQCLRIQRRNLALET